MSTQQQPPLSPQDAFEFMQKMWNPLGLAIPGFAGPPGAAPAVPPFANPALLFAALDPVELEKKINELQVVENWLTMSLNFVQMSVKTMELQKASIEALRAGSASGAPSQKT